MRFASMAGILATLALLSACGGDGRGATEAKDLSGYVGTWQEVMCSDRTMTTLTFRASDNPGTLVLEVRTEYYDLSNCTGVVLATKSHSPAFSATYTGAGEGAVRGPRPGSTVQIQFDKFDVVAPAHAFSVEGPTVQEVTNEGGQQWCFESITGTVCIPNPGPQPAATHSVSYFLNPPQLYRLAPNGTVFDLGIPYTKR